MRKILIAIIILVVCSGTCMAFFHNTKTNERQGCCSHHGGVCGCSNGRALCCDGTLSPSCGCY